MSKVYAKVAEDGRVLDINSDAFISDLTGWVEIDQGTGDKYHHAQGNYLPGPLIDLRGLAMYKLEDGKIIPRTAKEIEAGYSPATVVTIPKQIAAIMAVIEKIKKLFGGAWHD